MIILKLIEKLILLPVWIILAVISLCIKPDSQFIWLYKRGFYFPAYSFDDRNDCLLSGLGSGAALLCIEAAAFLILFCGCFIEVTVDMLRGYVSDRLLS